MRAPAGTAGGKGLGDWGGSGRFGLDGDSAEHDTASEDSRLSTIVVGHLVLRVVDKDLCGTCAFPARHLQLGRFGGGEGFDALWVGEKGGRGAGGARRGPGVGGDGRVIGRPIDGGERVGGEWGLDGREVCLDRGDPCWLSDVVCEDGKQLVLLSRVILEQLLSKSLALNRQGGYRGFRASRGLGGGGSL